MENKEGEEEARQEREVKEEKATGTGRHRRTLPPDDRKLTMFTFALVQVDVVRGR